MNKDRIAELAAKEAEELWGPRASEEARMVKVPLIKGIEIGISRIIYNAQTSLEHTLKIGRFRKPLFGK